MLKLKVLFLAQTTIFRCHPKWNNDSNAGIKEISETARSFGTDTERDNFYVGMPPRPLWKSICWDQNLQANVDKDTRMVDLLLPPDVLKFSSTPCPNGIVPGCQNIWFRHSFLLVIEFPKISQLYMVHMNIRYHLVVEITWNHVQ